MLFLTGAMLFLAEAVGDVSSIQTFIDAIISAVTSNINLTIVATALASIIAAGLGAMVAWKFARKGYNYVKNALTGKSGKF